MEERKHKLWSVKQLILILMEASKILQNAANRIVLGEGYAMHIDVEGRRARCWACGERDHTLRPNVKY